MMRTRQVLRCEGEDSFGVVTLRHSRLGSWLRCQSFSLSSHACAGATNSVLRSRHRGVGPCVRDQCKQSRNREIVSIRSTGVTSVIERVPAPYRVRTGLLCELSLPSLLIRRHARVAVLLWLARCLRRQRRAKPPTAFVWDGRRNRLPPPSLLRRAAFLGGFEGVCSNGRGKRRSDSAAGQRYAAAHLTARRTRAALGPRACRPPPAWCGRPRCSSGCPR